MESINPFARPHLSRALNGKKVLLGISGSIAAFKSVDLIRRLKSLGAEIKVIVTKKGLDFVTATTLETVSGNQIYTDEGTPSGHATMPHIDLARFADVVLIAPASAATISKLAQGAASDLLSTEILAFDGQVVVVPAMNPKMWSHPATKKNVESLKSYGYEFIGPEAGLMACGDEGVGRFTEPEFIVEELVTLIAKRKLSSVAFENINNKNLGPNPRKILLSMGPTRSLLDPVRSLSNQSTGVMGAHLAWEAFCRGYDATIVMGPCSEVRPADLPRGFTKISVNTAQEMRSAVLSHWPSAFAYLGAAAVLDWDVQNFQNAKIKKTQTHALSLDLKPNPDILAEVTKLAKPGQWILGFAAETNDLEESAIEKLTRKGCHFLFANPPLFGEQKTEGRFLKRDPATHKITQRVFSTASKETVAKLLFDEMEQTWNINQGGIHLSSREVLV